MELTYNTHQYVLKFQPGTFINKLHLLRVYSCNNLVYNGNHKTMKIYGKLSFWQSIIQNS